MPNVIRGADCQAPVSRRRMDINLLEWRRVKYFSVRDAIKSDTTGETNGLERGSLGKLFQHAEINFFEPRLQRTSLSRHVEKACRANRAQGRLSRRWCRF